MFRLYALMLLAVLSGTAIGADEVLPAYNTYQSVPFVVGDGGLAADMVGYFNSKLKGGVKFKLTQLSREQLNKTILQDANFKGMVMFLNPFFVDDTAKTKYLWTQPLMHDSNAVVSLGTRKLEYTGVDALKGLKFGGVKGNRYAGLEEHFGKDIQRDDVLEELSNIKKVAAGKIDVTIMANTTYRYLIKQMGKETAERSNLYVSSKTHADFDRFIMLGKGNAALGKDIDDILAGMKNDPAWKTIQLKYGLQ